MLSRFLRLTSKVFFTLSFVMVSACTHAEGFPFRNLLPESLDKPVVFNVWATWCSPCVKEMPELEELAAEGDYAVYALSIDRKERSAKKFWRRGGYTHIQMLHDASGKEFYKHYSGEAIPITFIVNKQGDVVATERGIRIWNHIEMKEKIQKHLK